MTTIKLPNKWTTFLANLPETGMGYQLVKVILKNGKILNNHKVLNSSFLLLEKDETLTKEDIAFVEAESF
ncbi:MAG: hypothetical protein H0X70_00030 [Segetibacter sp.]|nr:hypothetical protein [Segetibacter sp.]